MTPLPTEAAYIGVQTVTIVGAVFAAMKRYINGGVGRIEKELHEHVTDQNAHADEIRGAMGALDDKLTDVSQDLSGVKGYLGIGMPPRNHPH